MLEQAIIFEVPQNFKEISAVTPQFKILFYAQKFTVAKNSFTLLTGWEKLQYPDSLYGTCKTN